LHGNYALTFALISGILLALSFPRYGHPLFGWIALTPLIVALFESRRGGPSGRPGRAFLLGCLTGAGYFGGTVYWTGAVVSQFGGLSWFAGVLVAALLVAYLSIFPGLFALCLGRLGATHGRRAILLVPAIWVSTELARTYFWNGFPWVLLGYSQTTVLPVAQLASVTGVFGLSGLVAMVSAAIAYFAITRSARSTAALAGAGAVVLGLVLWGNDRLDQDVLVRQGHPFRVALIQGNIPQDEKWDDARARGILTTYLSMTREAARQGAQLVIWPESSTPFPFQDDRPAVDSIACAGDRHRALPAASRRSCQPRELQPAFLVKRDGTVGAYQKVHLAL
jgi:apolipoprotein N-acyltransferase